MFLCLATGTAFGQATRDREARIAWLTANADCARQRSLVAMSGISPRADMSCNAIEALRDIARPESISTRAFASLIYTAWKSATFAPV